MATKVSFVVRPYWLSSWFLRLCAVPFVLIDGEERRVTWGRPVHFELPPGHRLIGAGIRYRGARRLLGYRPATVDASQEGEIRMIAQNGPLNSEPFRVRVLP